MSLRSGDAAGGAAARRGARAAAAPRFFHFLHPAAVFAYFAGLFCFVFLFKSPLYMLALLAGVVALAFFYAGRRKAAAGARAFLPVAILFGLLNPVLVHRGSSILFYLLGNPVTLEACAYGAYNFLLLSCVLLVFAAFNACLPAEKFLYLFAGVLPRTAFVVNMSLRFLEYYKDRAAEIVRVQNTKGISFRGSLRQKLAVGGLFVNALLAWNLEEGMEVALALKSKDFGTGRRTPYDAYAFGRRDALWLAVMATLLAACAFGYSLGAGGFAYYPALSPLRLTAADTATLPCLAAYVLIPLIVEAVYGIASL
ncbi:MAG: energy-coupling factor transporter transmembrane protein EcfT [Firmicutes bacterium]|nr:energy-coupling factor transporter transmembrane protein EcfT [Bacillota bacterium]